MVTTSNERLRTVTSRQNAQVKELRRVSQQAELTSDGYCAIEGPHLVEEAIRSGLRFKTIFFSEAAESLTNRLLPQLAHQVEALLLPQEVFSSAVATETPQGVAAFVRVPDHTLDEILKIEPALLIAAVGIQDPGNLGTLIRSAEAFGATAVLAAENTVRLSNPKLIRASAGSAFRMPVVSFTRRNLDQLREHGIRILATSSHKGAVIQESDLTKPVAIFIGSEGSGIPKDYVASMDDFLRIPQSPKVESLNAGIAASVILYEAARQRMSGA